MMNRLAFIAKSKGEVGQWFERAKTRIPARDKGNEAVYLNELSAYAIEEYERAPRNLPQAIVKWVQDFIADVRAFLMAHGFEAKSLTAADLAAISRQFLRQQATIRENQIVQTFPDGEVLASVEESDSFKPDAYDAREFAKAVERIAAMEKAPNTTLTMGDTPAVLRALGARNLPIQIAPSVIHKAMRPEERGHDVRLEDLKNLPALLADPVMVFDSQTEGNALAALVEAVDENGAPVLVAVHLDTKGAEFLNVNKIASVYGKDNLKAIQNWMNGSLCYQNTKKASSWLHAHGLQLPAANTIKRLNPRVLTEDDVVNGDGVRFSVEEEEPTGHAQPLTAKVLTPSGFKLMGDIHVGDEVITIDGSATKVTDVFPQGKRPIYRVVLSDGSETRATADHLWAVQQEGEDGYQVRSLAEIMPDVMHGCRTQINLQCGIC
jgi:hypothetical protein